MLKASLHETDAAQQARDGRVVLRRLNWTEYEYTLRDLLALPNLFVSMLQRLGIESDRFASSTGTMRGLDLA